MELEGYFVQGLVHVSSLGSDYFQYHPRSMSLVGERSGRKFAMGDTLRVLIKEIEPSQGKIDLAIEGVSNKLSRGRDKRNRDKRTSNKKGRQ